MNKLNQLLEEVLEVKMTEIEETALFKRILRLGLAQTGKVGGRDSVHL